MQNYPTSKQLWVLLKSFCVIIVGFLLPIDWKSVRAEHHRDPILSYAAFCALSRAMILPCMRRTMHLPISPAFRAGTRWVETAGFDGFPAIPQLYELSGVTSLLTTLH